MLPVVYLCIIFESMHSIFALPGWHHKRILKKRGLVISDWYFGEGMETNCNWEGNKSFNAAIECFLLELNACIASLLRQEGKQGIKSKADAISAAKKQKLLTLQMSVVTFHFKT